MGTSSTTKPVINRKIAFWGGLFLSTVALALIALSAWFISSTHSDYRSAFLENPPILIEQTANTVFYMAPFAYLGLLVLGLVCIAVSIRGEAYSKSVYAKVNKVAGLLVVVGVVGMFFGSYLTNMLWAEQFRNNGYVECPNSFTITSKWFKAVWVESSGLCLDEGVRDMFRSYEYDVTDINSYISQRSP